MAETLIIEITRPRTLEDLESVRREASDRAYQQAVLDLIRQGEISSAYGAQLLGMNSVDMLEHLRQHNIPIADYSSQELRDEVAESLKDFTDPGNGKD
jgi:predicted HTH domain antitoxin